MRYEEPLFRPPSEAQSLLFQVTVGCSHNACVFCAMYRNKAFRVRGLDEVLEEIEEAREFWPGSPRVFLADGDAMAAPTGFLLAILHRLREAFPRLRRVGIYSTPQNLLEKSEDELASLARAGLSIFYLGLESGSDAVLLSQAKGVTSAQAVEAVRRGQEAGLRSSLMVLLGPGGAEGSEEHALETARAVGAIRPHYLSALTWFPVREAPLMRLVERGAFHLMGDEEILAELELLIANLDLDDTVFRANHASNPLPIGGRLNRDRDALLRVVRAARGGGVPLRPLLLRGT